MKGFVRKYLRIESGPVAEICAFTSPGIKTPRGARTRPADPEHNARNVAAVIRKVVRLVWSFLHGLKYFVGDEPAVILVQRIQMDSFRHVHGEFQ